MENKTFNHNLLESFGEKGIYSKLDWMKEAEGKRISAIMLREVANSKQFELSDHIENDKPNSKSVFERLQPCESARKNSFLLLGYAIELLLKSGFVSLLINAPKFALEKCVRNYGHNLPLLAEHLHIRFGEAELRILSLLGSFIVNETRYPMTASCIQDYYKLTNALSSQLADEQIFDMALGMYDTILGSVKSIDGTEDNPKIYNRLDIDSDGFLTFRKGGSFPPVFVIKYSAKQIVEKNNDLNSVRELLETFDSVNYEQILKYWPYADFYCVSDKKGLIKL